jgi:hypothetical protein
VVVSLHVGLVGPLFPGTWRFTADRCPYHADHEVSAARRAGAGYPGRQPRQLPERRRKGHQVEAARGR